MKFNKKCHLLTFELDDQTRELEIHANKEGLEILKNKIEALLNSEKIDHTHLLSEDFGGGELTSTKQSEANYLIGNVKIFKWS